MFAVQCKEECLIGSGWEGALELIQSHSLLKQTLRAVSRQGKSTPEHTDHTSLTSAQLFHLETSILLTVAV